VKLEALNRYILAVIVLSAVSLYLVLVYGLRGTDFANAKAWHSQEAFQESEHFPQITEIRGATTSSATGECRCE
jgi:hypothetical protein